MVYSVFFPELLELILVIYISWKTILQTLEQTDRKKTLGLQWFCWINQSLNLSFLPLDILLFNIKMSLLCRPVSVRLSPTSNQNCPAQQQSFYLVWLFLRNEKRKSNGINLLLNQSLHRWENTYWHSFFPWIPFSKTPL